MEEVYNDLEKYDFSKDTEVFRKKKTADVRDLYDEKPRFQKDSFKKTSYGEWKNEIILAKQKKVQKMKEVL